MIGFIIVLAIFCFIFWMGFKSTELLLKICIWLFIKLPFAIILFLVGILLSITSILFPIGKKCFSMSSAILLD